MRFGSYRKAFAFVRTRSRCRCRAERREKTMFELFNLNYCVTTAHTKPIVNKVENQENQHAQQSFQLVTMNK